MALFVEKSKIMEHNLNDTCVICCHRSDLFCVSDCDHPVCFECGTRMRFLCESKDCPICRTEIGMVRCFNRLKTKSI